MIVKLKQENGQYPDLSPDQPYYVIGIEADDYRILNDFGKPYLYPRDLFSLVDPREPKEWMTEFGEQGERYSYPPSMNEAGFFEDYFDGKKETVSLFWHIVNIQLSSQVSIV